MSAPQQQQQSTNRSDICAICLATAAARGGEFLCSPGCCGKWFHQSCIDEMKKAGKNFCPCCMKAFPTGPVNVVASGPAAIFGPGAAAANPTGITHSAAMGMATPPPVPPPPPAFLFQQLPQQQQQQQMPVAANNNNNGGFFGSFFPNSNNSTFIRATPAAAPAPAPAPTATGIFARLSQNRSQMPPSRPIYAGNPLEEDLVTPDTTAAAVDSEDLKKPMKGDPLPAPIDVNQLALTLTPEYSEETLAHKIPFHVRVSAIFNNATVIEEQKTPLDIVCVLDNSGSMAGSKIDNLKRAMEFVVSTLGEKDRLSVTTFNSSPHTLHGLWKMNNARKDTSRAFIQAISAGGGTDIYSGMRQGWQILQQRQSKNPASCMFLLTDGQDGSYLEEKKALAKTMREQGTTLFVFGFGNDHDSAHLIQIANAGEGSFIYVETNDTVIDAFGGAIGTQQGQLLRNIQLQVSCNSPNVLIEKILAGSYMNSTNPDRRSGSVTLADLYGGEKRDFLLQLSLPSIPNPEDVYPLITVQATYKQYGSEVQLQTSPSTCVIRRVPTEIYDQTPHIRDTEVDAQVQRLQFSEAMQQAMALADRGSFKDAKGILENMRTQLLASVSYQQRHPFVIGLLDDLNESERKIGSREAYESGGGRAMMSETTDMYSRQRAVFSKNSNAMMMQCSASNTVQERAKDFKSRK